MTKKILLALALLGLTGAAFAECKSNVIGVTVPGHYAAIDQKSYDHLKFELQHTGKNSSDLKAMIQSNKVIVLPSGIEVCVEKKDFTFYRLLIEIPGRTIKYWVPDEAVTIPNKL
ncbi:TPA: hypothetical protein RQN97_001663 [Klebsiella michiganensis]|nr:hypothetical protein [Klebsiella michiganensis]